MVIELVQVHDLFLQFLILPPQFMLFVSEKEKNAPLRAGPAIAIGELGDCLGRQMGWGRLSVALGPTSH